MFKSSFFKSHVADSEVLVSADQKGSMSEDDRIPTEICDSKFRQF